MDCSGRVYPRLFAGSTHDLRALLRGPFDDTAPVHIKGLFLVKSNYNKDSASGRIEMSGIGGNFRRSCRGRQDSRGEQCGEVGQLDGWTARQRGKL